MIASPAKVLQYYLIAANKAVLPADGTEDNWPITHGYLPTGEEDPDNYLTTYDYGADQEGGVVDEARGDHPAVQLRVRSVDYDTGYSKCQELVTALRAIGRPWTEVAVGSETLFLQGCAIQNGVMHIGREEDETRENFTINVRLTISEG